MEGPWFHPSDLAGLPGMNQKETAIKSTAARKGWERKQFEIIGGNGIRYKEYRYHIDSLPEETQQHLRCPAVEKQVSNPYDPLEMSVDTLVKAMIGHIQIVMPEGCMPETIARVVVTALDHVIGGNYVPNNLERFIPVRMDQ